jgi:hypothetical protein
MLWWTFVKDVGWQLRISKKSINKREGKAVDLFIRDVELTVGLFELK